MTNKPSESKPTVITIVLPADGNDKPASLSVKQGDLGHVSTFTYTDFATICRALNDGLAKFLQVQENPPGDVESKAKKPTSTRKASSSAKKAPKVKPAGKAPYHLLDASGNKRELKMMTDPFDVQEKCLKNRKMQFKELAEAEEIAQMLIEAGEVKITIAYKNGKPAKVVTSEGIEVVDPALKEAAEEESAPETDTDDVETIEYPEGIDDATQQALYDHLNDVDLVLAISEAVSNTKKHDWTNNLMKQREVKGAIHKHIEVEAEVEAVYQIFYDIDHTPTTDESDDSDDEGESVTEDEPQLTLI
ncbi:MAG: hypothetical protein AAFU54_19035 [Chloroflexota bacterium]